MFEFIIRFAYSLFLNRFLSLFIVFSLALSSRNVNRCVLNYQSFMLNIHYQNLDYRQELWSFVWLPSF